MIPYSLSLVFWIAAPPFIIYAALVALAAMVYPPANALDLLVKAPYFLIRSLFVKQK